MNWNGHAVMVGFGAPWADLQLLSAEGVPDVSAMTNPVIGFAVPARRQARTS
jgi:hypothetical protein